MKGKDIADTIFPLGILYLVYKVVEGWGLFPTTETTRKTSECPRGEKYTRGFFGDCDTNYEATGLLQDTCTCISWKEPEEPTPTEPTPTEPTPTEPTPTEPTPTTCSWLDYINPLSPCFLKPAEPTPTPTEPTPTWCEQNNYPPPCVRPEEPPIQICTGADYSDPFSPCFTGITTPTEPTPCEPTFTPGPDLVDACAATGGSFIWLDCGWRCR